MSLDGTLPLEALLKNVTLETAQQYVDSVGEQTAFNHAIEWASNERAAVREVAFVVLGIVALDYPPAFDALLARTPAACVDTDVAVRKAAAQALAHHADERVVPLLLSLAQDPDLDVRLTAISGLGIALDEPPADHPAIQSLLELLNDSEPRVRDMAAFVLGTQLDVDSVAIREGLRRLLREPDTEDAYPAAEAAVGLARRSDAGIVEAISSRLNQSGVGKLWLQAARELGDPRLLPMLLALREPDSEPEDPWVEMLEQAISRCSQD